MDNGHENNYDLGKKSEENAKNCDNYRVKQT